MADISLTFPDGASRDFPQGVTPGEVAAAISTSLGKKAISAMVNGQHWDLQWPIDASSTIAINTLKDEAPALELIRHDLAHIMARAVQELWPDVKVTIGPVIKDGWYYDFDRAEPFTPEDLGEIEAKMKEIINRRDPVTTEVWERARAIKFYQANNEPYKVELIESIPGNEPIRMYWHGHWQDLCRGPHLRHTGQVPGDSFKLMKVAGAYWRGDSNPPAIAADLWCGVPEPTAIEGIPAFPRRGREAGSPSPRPGNGAVPLPGGSAGHGVLAPERLDDLSRDGRLHAPQAGSRGLSRGQDTAGCRPQAVGSFRPLGQVPRKHVHHRDR